MAVKNFLEEISSLASRLNGQEETICAVAEKASDIIKSGGWVRMFGSGHSVIPVMDTFPRYGGYVGFYPIMDPRLMWTCASGPGGAEEVIWLERQEGYMNLFLRSVNWNAGDMLIVISHGGQNAAPVEIAQAAKDDGLFVVALTSMQNHKERPATHSSGKKIGDIADIIVDNCTGPMDAVIDIDGVTGKVAGVSTLSAIIVMQSIVAETAERLAKKGHYVKPFASPNTIGLEKGRNDQVYIDFRKAALEANAQTLKNKNDGKS